MNDRYQLNFSGRERHLLLMLLQHSADHAHESYAAEVQAIKDQLFAARPSECPACYGNGAIVASVLLEDGTEREELQRCDTCERYASDKEARLGYRVAVVNGEREPMTDEVRA